MKIEITKENALKAYDSSNNDGKKSRNKKLTEYVGTQFAPLYNQLFTKN